MKIAYLRCLRFLERLTLWGGSSFFVSDLLRKVYHSSNIEESISIQYECVSPRVMVWCTPIIKTAAAKESNVVSNRRILS